MKEAHSVSLKRKFLQDDCDLYYALADDELEMCCQIMNVVWPFQQLHSIKACVQPK